MKQQELAEAINFIKMYGITQKFNLIRMGDDQLKTISANHFDDALDPIIIQNNLLGNCFGTPTFWGPNLSGPVFQVGYCAEIANLLHLDSNKLTFNEKIGWYVRLYYFGNSFGWPNIVNNHVYEINVMTNYGLNTQPLTTKSLIGFNKINKPITYGGICTKCLQNYPHAEISDISTFKCWSCKNGF